MMVVVVAGQRPEQAHEVRQPRGRPQSRLHERSEVCRRFEVADHVEVVAHRGLTDRELRGWQEHAPQRPRASQHDREAVRAVVRWSLDGAVPQLYPEVALLGRAEELRQHGSRGLRRWGGRNVERDRLAHLVQLPSAVA